MSLVCVMSAKGAPGATTTAMLLAGLWPSDTLLVDADPMGGDVALRLLGEHGAPLDPDRGLLSLLPSARRGMTPEMITDHLQVAVGGQPVVAGMPGPEQSLAVAPLWPQLSEAFAGVPHADVIADVGQMTSRSPHVSLVEAADAVVVVYRPTAWSAVHTRRRLEAMQGLFLDRGTTVGIVAVADPRDENDVASAAARIAGDWTWVTDLGVVSLDPKAVVMFEGGSVRRPERSLIARSGRLIATELHRLVHRVVTLDEDPTIGAHVADESPSEPAGGPTAEPAPLGGGKRRRGGRRVRTPDTGKVDS
jgi:hypothetical protein